jgi:hypothetical protein
MAQNSHSKDVHAHFQACLSRLYFMDVESTTDEEEDMVSV